MLQVPPWLDRLGEPVVTGYRSKFFRHACPTNGCYYDQLPCWDGLIAAFPRKIRPTDVDGMVEIGGNFLFLEEKRAGCTPDEGQRKALLRLSRLPGVTVMFFRPGAMSDYEVLIFGLGEPKGWQPQTRLWLTDWLHDWACQADLHPMHERPGDSLTRPAA